MQSLLALLMMCAGCGPGFGKCRAGACSPDVEGCGGPPTALAIGDSIFRYNANRCQSIPDLAGAELGAPIENASRSGAKVSPEGVYLWGDIRKQYIAGDWDWVIVEGGINDLNRDCDCGACEEVLDSLASTDGSSGDIVDLVDQALSDGARVALVGYYDFPEHAKFGFGECKERRLQLHTRFRAIADARDGVVFVDPGEVVDFESTPAAYRKDGIHPTPEGSALVGRHLAEAMRAASAQ